MDLATLLEGFIKVVFVVAVVLGAVVPILVQGERKVSAWIQDRTGPNRVGPYGVIQPMADVIKFFFKEDVVPANAHRFIFALAPCLSVFTAIIAFATIPFGDSLLIGDRVVKLIIADLNIGVLWVFAIGSLSVYGILLAGWSSANHFSFMGGLRSSAQIVSYELGLTLSVVGVLLHTGSLRMHDVVLAQGPWHWNIWVQPIGFVVFLVAMFAETNRNPFDLPEAESELVAGYHTEYSAMRFAMFFMAEYVAMVTMSALMVTFYLGGWSLPGLELLRPFGANVYGVATMLVFAVKLGLVLFLFLWTRWTLPRFRYDQLMALGWKAILPLALMQVLASAVREVFGWGAYAAVMGFVLAVLFWFVRTPRVVPPGRHPVSLRADAP